MRSTRATPTMPLANVSQSPEPSRTAPLALCLVVPESWCVLSLASRMPESENGWFQRNCASAGYDEPACVVMNLASEPSGSPYTEPTATTLGQSSSAASFPGESVIA